MPRLPAKCAGGLDVVVVLERKERDVIRLVTLHDLLRAESAMAQKAKEEESRGC